MLNIVIGAGDTLLIKTVKTDRRFRFYWGIKY